MLGDQAAGLPPQRLAELAGALATGGLDFVKDDHGSLTRIMHRCRRVPDCAAAVRHAAAITGHPTQYVPSLSGDAQTMRRQLALARDEGLDTVMIAPLLAGFANVQRSGAISRTWHSSPTRRWAERRASRLPC